MLQQTHKDQVSYIKMYQRRCHSHSFAFIADSDDFSLCRVQKLRNPSIRCQDDGSFSPLQCEVKLCWCVHRNGTRLNQMTFPRTDDVSDATCTNSQWATKYCTQHLVITFSPHHHIHQCQHVLLSDALNNST